MTSSYFSPTLHQSAAPFSHFTQHGGTGYTAGIIGQDPGSGALVSHHVAEQCNAMLTNLETLLNELGVEFSDVVKTTVYLTDYQDFGAINSVYAERLGAPYPARTTVQVAALPLGAKVQIDAVIAMRS